MEVKSIDDYYLSATDKASQEEIDKQFYEDLKLFSKEAEKICICKFK